MIARTESARGVTEGHRSAYGEYGISNVEWLLSPDACDICKSKASEEWDIKISKEKFQCIQIVCVILLQFNN